MTFVEIWNERSEIFRQQCWWSSGASNVKRLKRDIRYMVEVKCRRGNTFINIDPVQRFKNKWTVIGASFGLCLNHCIWRCWRTVASLEWTGINMTSIASFKEYKITNTHNSRTNPASYWLKALLGLFWRIPRLVVYKFVQMNCSCIGISSIL